MTEYFAFLEKSHWYEIVIKISISFDAFDYFSDSFDFLYRETSG